MNWYSKLLVEQSNLSNPLASRWQDHNQPGYFAADHFSNTPLPHDNYKLTLIRSARRANFSGPAPLRSSAKDMASKSPGKLRGTFKTTQNIAKQSFGEPYGRTSRELKDEH